MRRDYSDIIDRERPVSKKHPPMDRMMRAAQFAPFAALTGHDEAVRETARLTEEEIELDVATIQNFAQNVGGATDEAYRTMFIAEHRMFTHKVDEKGDLIKDPEILKKIDEHTHTLVLVCEQEEVQIDIWKIIEILI